MGDESDVIGSTCSLMSEDGETELATVRICGIKYIESDNDEYMGESKIYLSEQAMGNLRASAFCQYSSVKLKAGEKTLSSTQDYDSHRLITTEKVKPGSVIVPQEFNDYYRKGKAKGQSMVITASNMYFDKEQKLKISDVTTEKNYKKVIGKDSYDEHIMDVFINPADFNSLFDGGVYQISVFADDSHDVDDVTGALRGMGMRCLPLKDAIMKLEEDAGGILGVVQVPLLILLVVVIFFIAYFVTRLILKSRDRYFSIVRMLGMSRKDVKRILDIEILIVITIAFALFCLICLLVAKGVINIAYLKYLLDYLTVKEFAGLYAALAVMAYMISGRAARKLFKASAMEAYRGEA